MENFLMGAIAMASCTAGLFFAKFWRTSRDRLFGMFAVAFFLLGATRIGLFVGDRPVEGETPWYWVRLVAFLLILVAIIDKNRRPPNA